MKAMTIISCPVVQQSFLELNVENADHCTSACTTPFPPLTGSVGDYREYGIQDNFPLKTRGCSHLILCCSVHLRLYSARIYCSEAFHMSRFCATVSYLSLYSAAVS